MWYRLAANQGHAEAQSKLGGMYGNGRGVIQDYQEASKWYRLAADQGHAEAQFKLGYMYLIGRGVTQDYILAHVLLSLAAANLTDEEYRNVATQARNILAGKMTPEQIAEAQQLARVWKPK